MTEDGSASSVQKMTDLYRAAADGLPDDVREAFIAAAGMFDTQPVDDDEPWPDEVYIRELEAEVNELRFSNQMLIDIIVRGLRGDAA